MIHNIPQPAFEEFVAERLAQDGVVEIRKNHSFVSCEQVRCVVLPLRQGLTRQIARRSSYDCDRGPWCKEDVRA
jgi:hypothetical protein